MHKCIDDQEEYFLTFSSMYARSLAFTEADIVFLMKLLLRKVVACGSLVSLYTFYYFMKRIIIFPQKR